MFLRFLILGFVDSIFADVSVIYCLVLFLGLGWVLGRKGRERGLGLDIELVIGIRRMGDKRVMVGMGWGLRFRRFIG